MELYSKQFGPINPFQPNPTGVYFHGWYLVHPTFLLGHPAPMANSPKFPSPYYYKIPKLAICIVHLLHFVHTVLFRLHLPLIHFFMFFCLCECSSSSSGVWQLLLVPLSVLRWWLFVFWCSSAMHFFRWWLFPFSFGGWVIFLQVSGPFPLKLFLLKRSMIFCYCDVVAWLYYCL